MYIIRAAVFFLLLFSVCVLRVLRYGHVERKIPPSVLRPLVCWRIGVFVNLSVSQVFGSVLLLYLNREQFD